MIVHLDTSTLVDALTGPRRSLRGLTSLVRDGHRLNVSTLVLFEWLRGPRVREELQAQESVLPAERAAAFSAPEARLAADLYRGLSRPRGREIDLAIAACALANGASLWTLNRPDFEDVPGLSLIDPRA